MAIWRPDGLLPRLRSRRHDALLQVDGVSRRFGGYLALNERHLRDRGRADSCPDRPERRRQDDAFQHCQRSAAADLRQDHFRGRGVHGPPSRQLLAMGIARNFQQVRLVRGLSVVENVMIGAHARMDRGLLGNMAEFCGSAAAERRGARQRAIDARFCGHFRQSRVAAR